MFVNNLNRQTLKRLFLLNLVINKVGLYTFFLIYSWAKYEPIWTNFAAQAVTLGANLLVKAQTIPQNAKCAFFQPKVAFTEEISILNMAKVFEICFFFIEICENS